MSNDMTEEESATALDEQDSMPDENAESDLDFSGLKEQGLVSQDETEEPVEVVEEVVSKESSPEPEASPKETEDAELKATPKEAIVEEAGVAEASDDGLSDELIYELPEEDEGGKPKTINPYDRPGKWYVVSITSGQEKLAKSNLETRTQTMNVASRIFEVTIPLEEQVEFKGTKKEVIQKKIFPGYILVRCILDDETWHVIRNTPSITGFVGAGTKPIPLRRSEVEDFLSEKEEGGAQTSRKVRPRLHFDIGETVRVKEGPFTDFQGEVTEINEEQFRVKLLLNIFGRETPVDLEFSQVSKQ